MSYPKKIYDPVHGFIYLSSLEKDLIDSYAFQRLHYLHQLGVSYLVYPGASHTRFEHSLGVMHVATQIFDKIVQKFKPALSLELSSYWRQVVRFAALCHDLGHLPFSHTAEKKILGNEGHEKWTLDLIKSSFLRPIWDRFQSDFSKNTAIDDIIKLAVGEEKLSHLNPKGESAAFTPWEQVMSQVITGDFFGADRIDYLLRDARCTGVSYGLFDYHQLIEMLCILPCQKKGEETLTLGIEENGIESCEALLLARHFMHKRVYQYPSVKAYSFHMSRFMAKMYREKEALSSLGKYISYTDNEVLTELRIALLDPVHLGHDDALSLFVREHRYHAIELPESVQEEDVNNWKKHCHIENDVAEAFFSDEKKEKAPDFFPVLSSHKKIIDARSCFSISIPSFSSNWLYISPKYIDSLESLLERHSVESGGSYAKN